MVESFVESFIVKQIYHSLINKLYFNKTYKMVYQGIFVLSKINIYPFGTGKIQSEKSQLWLDLGRFILKNHNYVMY